MDDVDRTAGALRTYEDFEPVSKWKHEEGSYALLIDLPGFKKEEPKVHLDNFGNLKISGEHQVDDSKWRRFRQDAFVPGDCNFSAIRARFEGGTLFINMPKIIRGAGQDQTLPPPKKSPPSELTSGQKKKYEEEQDDTRRKKPTSPRVVTEPPQKPYLTSMPKTPQHVAATQQQYDDAKQKPALTGMPETPKHEAPQKPISTGILAKPQYDKKDQEDTRQKLSPETIAGENKKYGKEEVGTPPQKTPRVIVAVRQSSETEKQMEGSQSRQPEEVGSTAEKIREKEKTPASGPKTIQEGKLAGKSLESYEHEGPALVRGNDKSKQLLVNVVAAMMVIATLLFYMTYKFASR